MRIFLWWMRFSKQYRLFGLTACRENGLLKMHFHSYIKTIVVCLCKITIKSVLSEDNLFYTSISNTAQLQITIAILLIINEKR